MKRFAFALVLASGAGLAAPVFAYAADNAHSMLEFSAQKELRDVGITNVDVTSLTVSQLAGITMIGQSGDYRSSEKMQQFERILAD
ncbi:hypothetical protein [Amaricoccus sp.]|uniref:hypothetical protein n=1 Tax=Amaricoccus sp. TaxID=1872485 RepID=UPI0026228751|nr:hypothetical protein [uncultured Amaricoccus sp.]